MNIQKLLEFLLLELLLENHYLFEVHFEEINQLLFDDFSFWKKFYNYKIYP